MRLLLDTHALLWWAHDPGKLTADVFQKISDGENSVFVSAVSAMEITTKDRRRKLEYDTDLARRFVADVTAHGFELLSISGEHAERAGRYRSENQDPWDRLLAAQAQVEGLILLSCDEKMAEFGVETLW